MSAKQLNLPVGSKLSEQQIRALFANGQNPTGVRYDPAIIDAAYALDGWGYLTPTQITGLNKLGLIVGNRYARGNVPAQKNITGGLGNTITGAGNQIGSALGG